MNLSKASSVKITFRIPKAVHEVAHEIATTRRISLNALVVDSLKAYVEGLVGGDANGKMSSDLGRIDRRVRNLSLDVEVLGEVLALYIYHWLCHQTPISESQRKAASIEGRERYERFIELVKERRVSERSVWKLLYDLSEETDREGQQLVKGQ